MGIIEKLALKAVSKVAEDIVTYNTISYMDEKHSADAIMDKSKLDNFLFIKKKASALGKRFYILDEKYKKKYKVQWDAISFGEPTIRLYDLDNNEIGNVYASKDCFSKWVDYYICKGKENLGKVIRCKTIKPKYELEFNGWIIEGDFLQYDMNIVDKQGHTVVRVHEVFNENKYIIEYNNVNNEKMAILMFMIIELDKNRKR